MLLDRPPNPNLKRPYIEIKNLKEAVHAMPVVVSSAKVSGLSVFVQTFLSDSLKLDEVLQRFAHDGVYLLSWLRH